MKKLIIFMLLICVVSFIGNTQTIDKLTAFTSKKYNDTAFLMLDSTVLVWGPHYKKNITKDLINKLGLGFPQFQDLKNLNPHNLTTDVVLPDSAMYKFVWDTTYNKYFKMKRAIMSYDAQGRVVQELQSEYDSTILSWVERQKASYKYDNQNKIIGIRGSVSIFTYYGDSCYYDQWGNINKMIRLKRNNMADSLDYSFKNEYEYDTLARPTQRIYSKFDLIHRWWNKYDKFTYTYDANGYIDQIMRYQWDDVNKLWLKKDSTCWDFNTDGMPVSQKKWTFVDTNWNLSNTEDYTYDGTGNLLSDVSQTLNGAKISYKEKLDYTYVGGLCTSTTFSLWDDTAQQFNPLSKWTYTYNGSNECTEAKSQTWLGTAWGNSFNDFDFHFYYQNQPYSTAEVTNANLDQITIYPNPANYEVNIQLGNCKKNGFNKIDIYDLHGKRVYALSAPFTQTKLKISTAEWANGIYIVKVNSPEHNSKYKIVIAH